MDSGKGRGLSNQLNRAFHTTMKTVSGRIKEGSVKEVIKLERKEGIFV